MDPHSRTLQRRSPNLDVIPLSPFRCVGRCPKPCDMAPCPLRSPASAKPDLAYLVARSTAGCGLHQDARCWRPRTTTEYSQNSSFDGPLPRSERMESSLDKGRLPLPENPSGAKYPLSTGLLAVAQHRFGGLFGPDSCMQVRQLSSSGKHVFSHRAPALTAQRRVYISTAIPPKGVNVRLSAQHINPKSSTSRLSSCLARLCTVAACLVFATRILACGLEVGRPAQTSDSALSLRR